MSLLGLLFNQHIRIMSDNMTSISYITDAIGNAGTRNAISLPNEFAYGPFKKHSWRSAEDQPRRFNVTSDSLSPRF